MFIRGWGGGGVLSCKPQLSLSLSLTNFILIDMEMCPNIKLPLSRRRIIHVRRKRGELVEPFVKISCWSSRAKYTPKLKASLQQQTVSRWGSLKQDLPTTLHGTLRQAPGLGVEDTTHNLQLGRGWSVCFLSALRQALPPPLACPRQSASSPTPLHHIPQDLTFHLPQGLPWAPLRTTSRRTGAEAECVCVCVRLA